MKFSEEPRTNLTHEELDALAGFFDVLASFEYEDRQDAESSVSKNGSSGLTPGESSMTTEDRSLQ